MNDFPCKLMSLPKVVDARGNLTYIEQQKHVPFDIQRVYFLYDVPADSERGAHGHRELQQFIVALSGSFDLTMDDGRTRQTFCLKKPWEGLYVPPMMWRELNNFSSGAVCLVLASAPYEEADYFRDYDTFLAAVRERDA